MHPSCRMDSFPDQRNQMPYMQHCYPSFEAIPPQMKIDMSRSPIAFETWPYGGNYYGHSIPMGCHSCYNHSVFPGYCGFRPPCSHYPPPSTFHYHGGYPSFPESYPVYFVPPHNSTEQPRYEYEKNVPRDHHCCGCPNHPHSGKEDSHVTVEEQEPDNENKSSNALIPVQFKNQQYPVVWIPPGNMKNRDQRDPTEKELKGRVDEKLKPSEQEPSVWSRWYPFDINSLGSLKHGGDGKGSQNLPNEESKGFPFPMVWMPYKPEEEKTREHKEASPGHESAERPASNLMDASAYFLCNNDGMCQSEASTEKFGGEVGSKTTERKIPNQKIIPVKQLEEQENKRLTEEAEGKPKGITKKDVEDSREKKLCENDGKRQSSPSKKSKLPPLCLRVDPLPKRKNGGGKLRSPSPPSHEGKSLELSVDGASLGGKENKLQDMQSSRCMLDKSKEVEPNGRKVKIVEVMDGITRQDSAADCKDQSQPQVCLTSPIGPNEELSKCEKSTSKAVMGDAVRSDDGDKEVRETKNKFTDANESKDEAIKVQSGDEQLQTQEGIGSSEGEMQNPVEAKEAKRKNLSEAQAAVVIQSAYRGFEVRKWEAMKKLKQVAEIRKQMSEVRSRIEALESSTDVGIDKRQMVVLGENIMSLLLKLDTIQGLHPTVRDFRKYVARELVSLQEKLDFLTTKKSEISNIRENASLLEHQKEGEEGRGNIIGEGNKDGKFGSVEPCQFQVSELSAPGSQGVEAVKLELIDKEECKESEDRTTAPLLGSRVDSGKAEAEPINELEYGLNNEVLDDVRVVVSKTESDDSQLERPGEPLPLDSVEKIDLVVDVTEPFCPGEAGVPEVCNQELSIDKQIETGKSEVLLRDQVNSCLETDITSTDSEAADINEVHQPPLGVFKEETVAPSMEGVEKENNFEVHHDDMVKHQEEFVAKAEEEVSTMYEPVGRASSEDEASVQVETKENDPSEDTSPEMLAQGEDSILNDVLDTSELHEPQPVSSLTNEIHDGGDCESGESYLELSLMENENHGGKASKPEIPRPKLSLVENQNHAEETSKPEAIRPELSLAGNDNDGGEDFGPEIAKPSTMEKKILGGDASKLVEPQPEFLSTRSENLGGEQKADVEMVYDGDNCLKENEVPIMEFVRVGEASKPQEPQPELSPAHDEIYVSTGDDLMVEETKESKKEFKEETREFLTPEVLEAVPAGNDKVIEQPKESEIIKEEALVGTGGADRLEVEGELISVSPPASQVSLASEKGSESDRKLVEENEKLREMMQKLLEAGNEQLIAISNLSGRVKDLEKKLARKKKWRTRKVWAGSSCVQPSNNSPKGSAHKIAV